MEKASQTPKNKELTAEEIGEDNTEEIIIKEPQRNFIILYDSVYKNTDLTAEEIALIVKLVSAAPTFKPTSDKLRKILKVHKSTLNKITKSLQEKGYLTIQKSGNKSKWIINQEPQIYDTKNITIDLLVNRLINGDLNLLRLKQYHRSGYIDDITFTNVIKAYRKRLKEILETDWLNDD